METHPDVKPISRGQNSSDICIIIVKATAGVEFPASRKSGILISEPNEPN
jgi:hypothetical protein